VADAYRRRIPFPDPEVPMTFTVDQNALRDCPPALAATGARVAAGATGVPVAVTVPRWAAADAAEAAGGAAQDALVRLGSAVRVTADLVTAAADDYRAADDRAVHRLRALR
jgi:hypothetical protein